MNRFFLFLAAFAFVLGVALPHAHAEVQGYVDPAGGFHAIQSLTKKALPALSTTVTTIKTAGGNLGAIICANTNAVMGYVQLFDVAGTVTLGTTPPDWFVPVPPTNVGGIILVVGLNFANAIKAAATTTATGSTALGTALDCSAGYN
jgi:hypothetical protein